MTQKKMTGKGDTFIVNIRNCQNHTWQGTVRWVEQQKELPFRSAIELIKLMDSAVEATEDKEEHKKNW